MTASTGQRFAFKRSKYFAKKVKLDGITFDSKREAAVYEQLKILEKAGKIENLLVHHRVGLHAHGSQAPEHKRVGHYEVDFCFHDNDSGADRWIDVKGMDTPLSAWKRKHFREQYGIEVEVWK